MLQQLFEDLKSGKPLEEELFKVPAVPNHHGKPSPSSGGSQSLFKVFTPCTASNVRRESSLKRNLSKDEAAAPDAQDIDKLF